MGHNTQGRCNCTSSKEMLDRQMF